MMPYKTKSNELSMSQDEPNTVSNKDVVLLAPMETKAAFSRVVYPQQHFSEKKKKKRSEAWGSLQCLCLCHLSIRLFYGRENQIKEGEL